MSTDSKLKQKDQKKVTWVQLLLFVILWLALTFGYHAFRVGDFEEVFGGEVEGSAATSHQGPWRLKHHKDERHILKRAEGATGLVQEWKDASELSLAALQSKLYYWRLDPLANTGLNRLPTAAGDRYVIFLTDCGGFNNIRMAFEYFVVMAWLTRRVLVLPPVEGFYLIDFGPFARMKPEPSDEKVTKYNEFFDIEHLMAAVPVISAEEFVRREGENLNLPESLRNADLKHRSGKSEFKSWARNGDIPNKADLAWSPLSKVIFFPSIQAVNQQFPEGVPRDFVHHREIVELTPDIMSKPILSFPSCKDNENFRYLVQVNTIAAFADEALSRSYKRMLRDNVHYRSLVFDVAARVIQFLGPFEYAALHVRRNDLQYKEVFLSAKETLENIRPLLVPKEKMYIATDEANPQIYFSPFIEEGFEIFTWQDFFTPKGGNVLSGVNIPRKLEGCIEQVICALGRVFAGTLESTFSSYIFRLRGYYDAPIKEVYFHTLKYSGDIIRDRVRTYSRKPLKGQIYKSEHPSIWEDADSGHTTW